MQQPLTRFPTGRTGGSCLWYWLWISSTVWAGSAVCCSLQVWRGKRSCSLICSCWWWCERSQWDWCELDSVPWRKYFTYKQQLEWGRCWLEILHQQMKPGFWRPELKHGILEIPVCGRLLSWDGAETLGAGRWQGARFHHLQRLVSLSSKSSFLLPLLGSCSVL